MAPFASKRVPSHRQPGYTTGRPTSYDPRFCDEVIEFMAKGYSLTAFAGHIRRARDTIYEWMAAHPEFSDAVHRARAARVTALEKRLIVADKSAQAASMIFALKNACPEEFAEVRNLRVEHNVKIEKLSDEQLREIINRHSSAYPMLTVDKAKDK